MAGVEQRQCHHVDLGCKPFFAADVGGSRRAGIRMAMRIPQPRGDGPRDERAGGVADRGERIVLSERPMPGNGAWTPTRLRTLQLAVALVAGAVLVAATAFAWWHAEHAADILANGHGEHLLHEIRRAHPLSGEGLDQPAVDALLARLRPEGLHCLTVFEPDLRVRAAGGDCMRSLAETRGAFRELHPGEARPLRDRFTTMHALPPLPIPPGGAADPRLPLPPGVAADPPPPPDGPHRWPFVIEYDAPPVRGLWATTAATTIASLLAAAVLIGGTVLTRRLAARADTLEHALAREQHLATLGEASAVLAHELRNPLSSIKGHAQLMAEQLAGDGRVRERADILVREALRLEALCEQLLSFVRASRVETVASDPAALLREAVEAVDPSRIELHVEHAPKRWPLDPLRMHQALVNLLQNAVQASPPAAPSRACARLEDGALVFEVRDHGPGVPPDEAERIFEPFHTTRVRGTGLGLAVARRVVELHGGTLDVRNHPDGGAVFRVRLPSS